MQNMVSMELTDSEQTNLMACAPMSMPSKPKYPWGLQISLTTKELAKLGLDATGAEVGGMVELYAVARVTSVSSREMENAAGGDEKEDRVELQIEQMCIDSEDEPEPKMGFRDKAKVLYDHAGRSGDDED
jgi:hypothetical protein